MNNEVKKSINIAVKILDAWLPLEIKYEKTPGLSVGIIHKNKIVYSKGFGFSNIKSKKKATKETCYRIASISKMFTAICIMQLMEKGKLKLNDPVIKYLPWFKVKSSKISLDKITIENLLSHSAGIFRDGKTAHWADDNFPNKKGLIESIDQNTLITSASKRFKYSNFGFAILGQIIEEISGLSYDEYVKRNIIKKLNLNRTWSDLTEESLKYLAKGYSRISKIESRKIQSFKQIKTLAYAPAAGFVSNISDLAKFITLFFNQSPSLILSINSKKKMILEKAVADKDTNLRYGLGIKSYTLKRRRIIGHSGGFTGFITNIGIDSKNEIGVIVLSNSIDFPSKIIADSIFEIIYYFLDNKKYLVHKDVTRFKKYEGLYRERWGDILIIETNGYLACINPEANSISADMSILNPISRNKFLIETFNNFDSYGEKAHFKLDKNGKSTRLIYGATYFKKIKVVS